jgi:SAM-dependent methyltransferase
MSFDVSADAYDRLIGVYSQQLSAQLADLAGVRPGQRAVDVGCGPGALTSELVARLGSDAVAAADPSRQFVDAARERHPGVEVALAPAEDMPFEDDAFDAALAQLVVHFMRDPVAGLAEMRRVTRPGGAVAASVWDHAGGSSPVAPFWRAAHELGLDAPAASSFAGSREGHLAELLTAVGCTDVEDAALDSRVEHATFDGWWEPFMAGVGPAGAFLSRLDAPSAERLRDRCREHLGDGPVVIVARAWAALGRA